MIISLSFIINPWQLQKSSFTFTNYLGRFITASFASDLLLTICSYQIFLSSVLGILLCDYYLIRKGNIFVPDLFSSSKTGIYYYNGGWNWRAYVAYIAGIIPNFPGFLDSVGVEGVPIGAIQLYYLALPVGIFVGGLSYYGLNVWKPPPEGIAEHWNENVEVIDAEGNTSDGAGDVEVAQAYVGEKSLGTSELII